MADVPCIHCREQHPSTTAFCPNTSKSLRPAAGPSTGAGPGPDASAVPPAPGAEPATSTDPPRDRTTDRSIPSWVTDPDAAAVHPSAQGLGGDGELGVLDLLQRAFQLYKTHAKMLIAVAAVVFVPGALAHACARAVILAPTVALNVALDPVTHLPVTAPIAMGVAVAGVTAVLLGLLAAGVTGLFLHGIIIPLAHGALALATADRIAGGSAGWREIWTLLFRRLGIVLSAIIPAALLMGVGFFFLVVPGLILAFFFSFVPTIALFEGVGGTAALRRSFELVRSDWLRMLLVMIVFGIMSAVAQFVAGTISRGLFGSQLLQDALTLVAMPIPVIGSVLLYFDVRRKKEGFDERQLAQEMQSLRAAA